MSYYGFPSSYDPTGAAALPLPPQPTVLPGAPLPAYSPYAVPPATYGMEDPAAAPIYPQPLPPVVVHIPAIYRAEYDADETTIYNEETALKGAIKVAQVILDKSKPAQENATARRAKNPGHFHFHYENRPVFLGVMNNCYNTYATQYPSPFVAPPEETKKQARQRKANTLMWVGGLITALAIAAVTYFAAQLANAYDDLKEFKDSYARIQAWKDVGHKPTEQMKQIAQDIRSILKDEVNRRWVSLGLSIGVLVAGILMGGGGYLRNERAMNWGVGIGLATGACVLIRTVWNWARNHPHKKIAERILENAVKLNNNQHVWTIQRNGVWETVPYGQR